MLDVLRFSLALFLSVSGVFFYCFLHGPTYVRWGSFLAGLFLAAFVVSFTKSGRVVVCFLRDSYREVSKVVWPTGRETLQVTFVVFLFVVLTASYLRLVDKLLEWLLYSVILGWGL